MRSSARSPTWHPCYFASSDRAPDVSATRLQQSWRQALSSTTPSPLSFPICSGGKGAVKQLETHLILTVSINSSQNRLKTQNLVSIYASYQITWLFSGQVFSWLTSWGKAMVQGLWWQEPLLGNCCCGFRYTKGLIPFQTSMRGRGEQKPTFLSSSQIAAFNDVSSAGVKSGWQPLT